jgi:ABC-type metal ion transport system substrate-binding protein
MDIVAKHPLQFFAIKIKQLQNIRNEMQIYCSKMSRNRVRVLVLLEFRESCDDSDDATFEILLAV